MTTLSANRAYAELGERFASANKLRGARDLLIWDSQTYMPEGGAWSRGEQLAALEAACKDLIAAPDAEELFGRAYETQDALSPVERANLVEMRRIWSHQAATPKDLLMEKAKLSSALLGDWRNAKAMNDFDLVAKGFGQMLSLHRAIAGAKGESLGLKPYDALMDEIDPGLSTAIVSPIFEDLAAELPPLLAEVIERQALWPKPTPFAGNFSDDRQRALSYRLLGAVGHSIQHSRIDLASHPFALGGSPGDVRITTRFDQANIRFSIMATLHEAGHALYEFNLPRELAFSPVGAARGATVHESQSIMVEMLAGRGLAFLRWLAPQFHEVFGGNAEVWSVANLLNIYRRVGAGFIRVEADEISYPLHVILRYRLERALLSGDLTVIDLPGAWSDLSQALFGRRPPDHARGCLQDIHWAAGLFGHFPSYALGQALAAQLFERACADDPLIPVRIGTGDFGPYRAWVAPRIHHRASQDSFTELVQGASAAPLSAAPLKRHLRRRYLHEPAPHELSTDYPAVLHEGSGWPELPPSN